MPQYLPFAGKNAIVEMAAGIQFQSPFDAKISTNVDAVRLSFSQDFPKFEPVQQVTFNVGPSPLFQPPAPSFNGFILTRMKADNTPARMLRVMGNVISVHLMEYDSWKLTRELLTDHFKRCLTDLKVMDGNAAIGVFLRYVDRFSFEGNSGDATAKALFKQDCRLLPHQIFGSGSQWYSNSGWHEDIGGVTTLNNLNISANALPTATVTVDHTSFYPFPNPCNVAGELFDGSRDRPPLLGILDKQHQANASILRALLSDKISDMIGLSK